jgi:hypothetical protein
MANEATLFADMSKALANSDMFKSLQDTNNNLAGGNDSLRRISIRGSRFRQMVGGEQVHVRKEDFLNVVILDAAPVSRTYFEGKYDPENPAPPTCWSPDGERPDEAVADEHKQSTRCMSCPQNIKGSGANGGRACRYGQRVALAVEGDMENVYQMQLPAASIFGKAEGGKMPMQAYVKLLNTHKMPATAVLTQMYFDEDAETPKLFFKPERPLEEAELQQAVALREHEDVARALKMTVSQTDGVQAAPQKAAPAKTNNVLADTPEEPEAPKAEEPEEAIEEPKKAKTQKSEAKAEAASEGDLGSIIDEWDD